MHFGEVFKTAREFGACSHQYCIAERCEIPGILDVLSGALKNVAMVLSRLWMTRFNSNSVRMQASRALAYYLRMRFLVRHIRDNALVLLDHVNLLGGPIAYDCVEGRYTPSYSSSWFDNGEIVATFFIPGENTDVRSECPERDAVAIGAEARLISSTLHREFAVSPMRFRLVDKTVPWTNDEPHLLETRGEAPSQLRPFHHHSGIDAPIAAEDLL